MARRPAHAPAGSRRVRAKPQLEHCQINWSRVMWGGQNPWEETRSSKEELCQIIWWAIQNSSEEGFLRIWPNRGEDQAIAQDREETWLSERDADLNDQENGSILSNGDQFSWRFQVMQRTDSAKNILDDLQCLQDNDYWIEAGYIRTIGRVRERRTDRILLVVLSSQ